MQLPFVSNTKNSYLSGEDAKRKKYPVLKQIKKLVSSNFIFILHLFCFSETEKEAGISPPLFYCYTQPRSAKDTLSLPPVTIWSNTLTSIKSNALTNRSVICLSAPLGSATPLG